ncbi:MAG: hypothetical protein JO272_17030 [Pseudonocardiales bacterium]|nr:hypothetical protein [Pseudonocardiales bacterium]
MAPRKYRQQLKDCANSAGKWIVAKLAVFAVTSGSVLALSATPAVAHETDAFAQNGDTYIKILGNGNSWTASGWCIKCGYHGHFQLFFPDGTSRNFPDSNNPELLNLHGTGSGKFRVINWKPTSSGYENMGEPSVNIR